MRLLKNHFLLSLILLLGLLCGLTNTAAAQDTAEIGFFEDIEVQPDQAFEVPVIVRDVTDLFAVDIEIRFDPAVLQARDASPNQTGIQVGLATFLDPGLVYINQVDNNAGLIRFVMTQVNPSEPKSGDGIVLVLYFTAQAEGDSALEVSFAEASTNGGEAIALDGVDGTVTVSASAAQKEATQIPVQDIEQVTIIPTQAPTATPTITPTFDPTPTVSISEGEEGTEAPGEQAEGDVADETQDSQAEETQDEDNVEKSAGILDYWWVVLIVVLAAGGAGAYLVLSKKKS
jgi:hypothetical protein